MDQAILEKIRKECEGIVVSVHSNSHLHVFDKGGNIVYDTGGEPCCACMGRWGSLAVEEVLSYVVTRVCCGYPCEMDESHFTTYAGWLVNESPWVHIFVEKDPAHIRKTGFVLRTDVPHNMIVGAVMAARVPTEWRRKAAAFCALVERGVKGNTAYLLSHCVHLGTDGSWSSVGSDGHTAVDTYRMGERAVRDFLRGAPDYLGKIYSSYGKYHDIHETWGRLPDYGSSRRGLAEEVEAVMNRAGTLPTPHVSPFKAKLSSRVARANVASRGDSVLNALVAFALKLEKEL